MKDPEKILSFLEKSVWSCWGKFCLLRQEYLSSAFHVLANSLKIYDHGKAVFFELNLPENHGEKG